MPPQSYRPPIRFTLSCRRCDAVEIIDDSDTDGRVRYAKFIDAHHYGVVQVKAERRDQGREEVA